MLALKNTHGIRGHDFNFFRDTLTEVGNPYFVNCHDFNVRLAACI